MKPNYTYLVLLCISIVYSNTSFSQSIFSSSKGQIQAQEIFLDWSVGETMITTVYGEQNYTQGFHQPLIGCCPIPVEPKIDDFNSSSIGQQSELFLFPNPVEQHLNIEITIPNEGVWFLAIYDATGKLVHFDNQYWSSGYKISKSIDVSYYEAGQYYARIYKGDFSSIKKFHVTH